jgi:CBS domain containing-hemolysin-like protein
MSEAIGNFVFILLLVFANGFFVAAEFAIVKVRSSQITERLMQGDRKAPLAKHITEHLDAYLSATQLGITLTSLGLGWIGEPMLADMVRPPLIGLGFLDERAVHAIAFGLSFGILTFLHITLGELAPKSVAIQYAEQTTFIVSWPLQLFYRVFKPAIVALNGTATLLLKIIGVQPSPASEYLNSAEELQIIVSESARSGVLDKTEQELISSIFEFSNTSAREVMVPRTEMLAIDIDTPRDRILRIVTEEGYSRVPIYKGSLDNIIGVVYTKDLITLLENRDLIILQDILRPPYFVPDAIKISKLMRDLQQKKIHMAIVVDEFGGTQGIITMEDILEEIVGEIHDEYDEVLKDVEQSADGSALVNGRIAIEVFNEKFEGGIPEDPEYETLNGFLAKHTGRLPEVQEEIRYGNLQFTVLKKSNRRIRLVKVRKVSPPPEEPEEN